MMIFKNMLKLIFTACIVVTIFLQSLCAMYQVDDLSDYLYLTLSLGGCNDPEVLCEKIAGVLLSDCPDATINEALIVAVKKMINVKGSLVLMRDQSGRTPLHCAYAKQGRYEVAAPILIAATPQEQVLDLFSAQDNGDATILHYVAVNGLADSLREIFKGVDKHVELFPQTKPQIYTLLKVTDFVGSTPLNAAIKGHTIFESDVHKCCVKILEEAEEKYRATE